MTPFSLQLQDLSVRYRTVTAVDHLSFEVPAGTITGLLGRNGSGKTTLLSVAAAFRKPSGGRVLVNGQEPFENAEVMAGISLVREGGDLPDLRVGEALRYMADTRSTWDADLAGRLLERFRLPAKRSVQALSRGQRSAVGAIIGLASRAPLTMFDEVYLGMDAPTRQAFYDELLQDYMAHPRTIVLSSHLIEEVERLFEQVVIIDGGRLLLQDEAEALRDRGVTVTGPHAAAEAFARPYPVLRSRRLGGTSEITLYGTLDHEAEAQARDLGLELGRVAIQDLFIHLTDQRKEAR